MSQQNVEIIRESTEAFLRGDWDTAFESVDPEIEWEETPSLGPDASVYRGINEARRALESWMGMWTEYQAEVSEYLDAGDDVVVLFKERGHGGASDAVVERQIGTVYMLRDGNVVRARLFGNWSEAREAGGLSR